MAPSKSTPAAAGDDTSQPVDRPVDQSVSATPAGRSATDRTADDNAKLRERISQLEEKLRERGEDPGPSVPQRPSFGISEGERADLEMHGVTTSAFTGDRLTASGERVEPGNDRAKRADQRASNAGSAER